MTAPWPLPIAADPRLSVGDLLWSTPQSQLATVVAKLTLAADASGALSIASPRPLASRDELEGGHPAKSVVVPADLAPFAPAAEVVVRGAAWQAGGAAAPTKAVKLGVYRGQRPLLTKVLHVYGDRLASAPREVQPFTSLPVVWERAVADATNPIGRGMFGPGPLPNVINPTSPASAAGFCAIPRGWQIRRSLLGAAPHSSRGELFVELPSNFQFSFYQCAPTDQRTPHLAGDEWLVVEGMHPELQSFQVRLPGVRAAAIAVRASGRRPVEMKLDLVCIDMASLSVTLTFRGMSPLEGDEPVSFAVTLEERGSLAPWPEAPAPTRRGEVASVPPPNIDTTRELGNGDEVAAKPVDLAPFPLGAPRAGARAEIPGAPWAGPARPVPSATERGSTVALETPARPAQPSQALPAERVEPPEPVTPLAAPPAPRVEPAAEVANTPAPAKAPRKVAKRPAKRAREPKTPAAMEQELLARGLPREDVQAIVAALKS